jgi:hypothetical protein
VSRAPGPKTLALLRQSGGFEGLCLARIEDPPHDLPVPERKAEGVWRGVHLNPAAASTQALLMNQRYDRLPRIDELNLCCCDVLPCRKPASPIRPHALVAVVGPREIESATLRGARSVPLDLGVVVVERGLMIATGETYRTASARSPRSPPTSPTQYLAMARAGQWDSEPGDLL